MEILVPKYRRNPNEKIVSVYAGVAQGHRTVTTIVRPSEDRNRLQADRTYGPGIPRGQGGQIGVLVLGGMETTLDEMEYILAATREEKFVPYRSQGEIAAMCKLVAERRNEQIEEARRLVKANPSLAPKKRREVRLHLPVGIRYVGTREPGMKVLARI